MSRCIFAHRASRTTPFWLHQHEGIRWVMARTEPEAPNRSPAQFPERVDGFTYDFGIGIFGKRTDLIGGRWIAYPADDAQHSLTHLGVCAAQVSIKLVQLAVV